MKRLNLVALLGVVVGVGAVGCGSGSSGEAEMAAEVEVVVPTVSIRALLAKRERTRGWSPRCGGLVRSATCRP